jgi:hypothetical protein
MDGRFGIEFCSVRILFQHIHTLEHMSELPLHVQIKAVAIHIEKKVHKLKRKRMLKAEG